MCENCSRIAPLRKSGLCETLCVPARCKRANPRMQPAPVSAPGRPNVNVPDARGISARASFVLLRLYVCRGCKRANPRPQPRRGYGKSLRSPALTSAPPGDAIPSPMESDRSVTISLKSFTEGSLGGDHGRFRFRIAQFFARGSTTLVGAERGYSTPPGGHFSTDRFVFFNLEMPLVSPHVLASLRGGKI